MAGSDQQFSSQDLERLAHETFVASVDYHRELGSTNDRALQLVTAGQVHGPTLVLAEHQRAGRGRGTNAWWTERGALTFSLILQPRAFGLSSRDLPLLSLATGLAVCDTVTALAPQLTMGLKWPNDVHANGRKIAGVLLEMSPTPRSRSTPPSRSMPESRRAEGGERTGGPGTRPGTTRPGTDPWLVVGIGLNVGNSLRHAPDALRPLATSLVDETGSGAPLGPVLLATLQHLARSYEELARDREHVLSRWQALCVLRGHPVSVRVAGQTVSGTCRGIDETGGLLLDTAAGTQQVFAGEAVRIG